MKKTSFILIAASLLAAQVAEPAVITVNSTSDTAANDGQCTLREAIIAANNNAVSGAASGECAAGTVAPDTVAFGIGSGKKTIALSSVYPDILSDVTLDATTQPGFSSQPLIELNGQAAAGSAFRIAGDGVTVKGFAINRFTGPGIGLQSSAEQFKIQGNHIGLDPSGTVDQGNGASGIECGGCRDGLIGGSTPGEGNVISGNAGFGIFIYGSGAQGNSIVGNKIGTDATGESAIPNDEDGVYFNNGAHDNVVGGMTAAEGNLISGNAKAGIATQTASTSGNSFEGNSIFLNGGLGIDLNRDGITNNDADDVDTGPNDLQNFPVLNLAVSAGDQTTIRGTLNSTAGTNGYRIEFFSNDSCNVLGHGDGQTFLGAITDVNTNSGGDASFQAVLSVSVPSGKRITATATDPSMNTSEFSTCLTSLNRGSLQFSAADYGVDETDEGAAITVTRVGGSDGAVSVVFSTSDATASAESDYTSISETVTFADGDTASKTVTVPILDDSILEGNETIALSLTDPTGGAALGDLSAAVLTIRDIGDGDVCGNGVIESGEECDGIDGCIEGEACNSSCQCEASDSPERPETGGGCSLIGSGV